MRRRDREINDFSDIAGILERCDTVRLAFSTQSGPYIVPLSYGFDADMDAQKITVYIHSAAAGRKYDELCSGGKICAEWDNFLGYRMSAGGITASYESVIAEACARPVEGEEKIHALQRCCAHCGFDSYPVGGCGALERTAVFALELNNISGKQNLPRAENKI